MNKLVLEIPATPCNGRNSEGTFFRAPNGDILYAYSRWNSSESMDESGCDIALIRSSDEGDSWSDFSIIASAKDFGVSNIMCASALPLADGRLCVYFLIREKDGTSTVGRVISSDGIHFTPERCTWNLPSAYYVIENDRFIRLSDGQVATVASQYPPNGGGPATVVAIVSDDDGKSFHDTKAKCTLPFNEPVFGLEEPLLFELSKDVVSMLVRTICSYQYQAFSVDGLSGFTPVEPSVFTSPRSPIVLLRLSDNSILAAYNPIPLYNGRTMRINAPSSGRTPLVLRRSKDNGKSWGSLYCIEDDPMIDFAYPSLFETKDGSVLCAYWCKYGQGESGHIMRITKCTPIPD